MEVGAGEGEGEVEEGKRCAGREGEGLYESIKMKGVHTYLF